MRKMFKFLFWVVLVIGIIIGIARATCIRWLRMPSDDPYLTTSTAPSVRAGDLILLWRLTKPGFGDLVLCPEPKHPERFVIARLVGEQNDDLEITGADITVNHKRIRTESNCMPLTFQEHDPGTGFEVEQNCQIETMGGGSNKRGELVKGAPKPEDIKTSVPGGQVWLVSDNRQYPWDSREFGPVDRESCKETVFFRLVGSGGFFDTSTRNQYIH
jgi:signal peptidase I